MDEATRGSTRPVAGTVFLVLLALADRERYGLDVAKEVEEMTEGRVVLGPGTLYNAVGKMLAAGLIEETTGEEREHGQPDPRRRYYRVTAAGRATLADEVARLESLVGAARAKKLSPSK